MEEKFEIIRLVNPKPVDMTKIKPMTSDQVSSMILDYHETMISQIVKSRDEHELRYVCSSIQKFIEKNGIDVCFVMDEDALKDCLQQHQLLKLELEDLKAKYMSLLDDISKFCEENKDSNEYDYVVNYEPDDIQFVSTRAYLKDYINKKKGEIENDKRDS